MPANPLGGIAHHLNFLIVGKIGAVAKEFRPTVEGILHSRVQFRCDGRTHWNSPGSSSFLVEKTSPANQIMPGNHRSLRMRW